MQKKVDLNLADAFDEWKLSRLQDRKKNLDKVWILPNFIVVKCGSELAYMKRGKSGLFSNNKPKKFSIEFGSEVWIEDIYTTGVADIC